MTTDWDERRRNRRGGKKPGTNPPKKTDPPNQPVKSNGKVKPTGAKTAAGLASVASSLAGMHRDSWSGFEGSTTDINAWHPETTESGSVNDNDDKNYKT